MKIEKQTQNQYGTITKGNAQKTPQAPKKHKVVKTFAGAPLLPLLLTATVERWMVLAIVIFAAVVVLVSLIYIYAILHERRVTVPAHFAAQKEVQKVEQPKEEKYVTEQVAPQEQTYEPPIPFTPVEEDEAEAEEEEAEGEPIEPIEPMLADDEEIEQEVDPSLIITDENGEVVEVLRSVDQATGIAQVVRYNKSFTAKYIQMTDESKAYYNTLKNYILSYKKTRSRISWKYDNIHAGKEPIARFAVRGKTLCLYTALNPDDYADSKYKVERSDAKKFEDVPCLYRIINPRRVRYAMELIAELCDKYSLERGAIPNENYYLPYEHTGHLIKKAMIREYLVQESYDDFLRKKNAAAKAKREQIPQDDEPLS